MKLLLKKYQNLFFTSDTHYNHTNICRGISNWKTSTGEIAEYATRAFDNLEEMNSALVDNINNLVKETDILIHLGDWSFGGFESIKEFRNRIQCKNIHLVLGNHDHHIRRNKDNIQSIFSSVQDYLHLNLQVEQGKRELLKRYDIICMHYPIASWDNMNKSSIHLHGHVHLPPTKRLSQGKAMDVGVDGNYLHPISYQEIIEIMDSQPIKKLSIPQDHHEH